MQDVDDDLVEEKEEGWNSRTFQDWDTWLMKRKWQRIRPIFNEYIPWILKDMGFLVEIGEGFKKWHASHIVTKKGEKFALNCVGWTKLSNIKQMYEYIYDKIINAHIASPWDNPVYMD